MGETLKIAFVYDVIYPWVKGGVEKRIYELAKRLTKKHEVHIYGYKFWDGLNELEKDGIHYHGTVRVAKLYSDSRRSILPPLLHSISLISRFKGIRFDIVDCQASPYLPAYSLRILDSENIFITWHEFWSDYWLNYLGWLGLFGKTLERGLFSFEKHISVSQKTKFDLLRAGLQKPIAFVPNGIDYGFIHSVKPAELKSDFIFVGRLIPEKGVDFLLKALAIIKEEFPDFKTIIVGDGPERTKLEKLSKELGIRDNIVFTGPLASYTEVIALIKASKVFAFPSRREGFGMVVLEAMASGRPVVTVWNLMNASAYLVENGKTGFVTRADEKSFADALAMALMKRKKLGKIASRKAQHYDWDEIAGYLLLVYRGD